MEAPSVSSRRFAIQYVYVLKNLRIDDAMTYTLNVTDFAGDGICCDYNSGPLPAHIRLHQVDPDTETV
jgi:hypothetical protein